MLTLPTLVIGVPTALYFVSQWKKVTVLEFQAGLKFRKGLFRKTLGPGTHWIYTKSTEVIIMDMRPVSTPIENLTVLSADGIPLSISLSGRLQVVDARTAFSGSENCYHSAVTALQGEIRKKLSSASAVESLRSRSSLVDMFLSGASEKLRALGMQYTELEITELTSPEGSQRSHTGFVMQPQ